LADHDRSLSMNPGKVNNLTKPFQHISVCVDGAPKPVFSAPDGNHDLVEMPFVGRDWAIATDPGGDLRSEPLAPHPDAFIRDDHAPFGQQVLDIAQAQRKPMVRPDGIGDDGPREPKALQARL